jgi:hypothetical protein
MRPNYSAFLATAAQVLRLGAWGRSGCVVTGAATAAAERLEQALAIAALNPNES